MITLALSKGRILDETLPPPEWACKRLRNDGLTVSAARVRS